MTIASLCVCFGQLCWKLSADSDLFYLLCGFALYGLGAIIMIFAYRFGSLSVLQPVLSLSYIISLLIGYYILHEELSMLNILGVFVIVIGVVLVAAGD